MRPACREEGVISATPGGMFEAAPGAPHRRGTGRSCSGTRGRWDTGGLDTSLGRNRLRFSPAGSAPPGPVPEGSIRVYSMRFCPFAERTRLVLKAKGIRWAPRWGTLPEPSGSLLQAAGWGGVSAPFYPLPASVLYCTLNYSRPFGR